MLDDYQEIVVVLGGFASITAFNRSTVTPG